MSVAGVTMLSVVFAHWLLNYMSKSDGRLN